jgi:peptidoglycan/LPS O-acetylase OafA/YrhL
MLKNSTRILHIDAWRFIAVTMVVISHILKFSNPWYRDNLPWFIIGRAQELGLFGVKIFFCISGFVICRGLINETKLTGSISMKTFYVRRFLRILPPLFLYIFVLELLSLLGVIEVKPSQLAYAGMFLCNIHIEKCGWLLGHTWSLAYEEQFYVFFPIIFAISSVFGGRKAVLGLTISMMAVALAAICAGLNSMVPAIATFSCMLTGCVSAMYWDEIQPLFYRISLSSWCALTTMTSLAGFVIIWPISLGLVVSAVILPASISAMVLSTPTKSRRISDFFLNPTVTYLGKISFTIYLWQQLATSSDYIKSPWINFLALAGAVVLGIFSYRYLERPLIIFGAKYSERLLLLKTLPLRPVEGK